VITIIMGRRELGKSTLALYMATRRPYAVVFDPRHLFQSDASIGDLTTQIARDALDDRFLASPPVVAVVQPNDALEQSSIALADFVRRWTETRLDRLAVVLDEAALYAMEPWAWVVRCAPRQQIDLILTAHRPQDIPTTIRALADTWCVFRTTQPHDLEAIEDRCGIAFSSAVERLQPRHFAVWDDAKGSWSLRTQPGVWYVPIRSQSPIGASDSLVPGEPEEMPAKGLF
jgi:hypothetical protein